MFFDSDSMLGLCRPYKKEKSRETKLVNWYISIGTWPEKPELERLRCVKE
ncbi:hypothetical protein Syun_003179 [Stephania yunnanensis]|uniref:Uncharacterized protein n=1 Tax=Stephania yunnanensis TaxID=152371 RepID=A0AAP0PZM6_9MAGN